MNRHLTVLQVLPALDSGGVERGTMEISRALVAAGHRSLVMSAGGRQVARLEAEGGIHLKRDVRTKSLWTLRQFWSLRKLLASGGIDIVHARSRMPAWLVWLALTSLPSATRPRFVTTVHGPNSVNRYSAIMTYGERVIAVSRYIETYIRQHYDVDPATIRTIPRGVDPSEFPYGLRPDTSWLGRMFDEFPQARGKRLLAMPGRITRLKGHVQFIEMVAALVDAREPVHGLIIGDIQAERTDYGDELLRRIHEAGLDAHISLTGHRSDLREWLAVSDIVYTLSSVEAFGRTTAESLALGRPTIGFRTGGTAEVLGAVYPEGLVEPGDVAGLVATTQRFLRDPPLVPPDQPFTLQRMTDATLAVYEELVNSPR